MSDYFETVKDLLFGQNESFVASQYYLHATVGDNKRLVWDNEAELNTKKAIQSRTEKARGTTKTEIDGFHKKVAAIATDYFTAERSERIVDALIQICEERAKSYVVKGKEYYDSRKAQEHESHEYFQSLDPNNPPQSAYDTANVIGKLILDATRYNQPILLDAALKRLPEIVDKFKDEGSLKQPLKDAVVIAATNGDYTLSTAIIDAYGGSDQFFTDQGVGDDGYLTFGSLNKDHYPSVSVATIKSGIGFTHTAAKMKELGLELTEDQISDIEQLIPDNAHGIWPGFMEANEWSHIENLGVLSPDVTAGNIVERVRDAINRQ